MLWLYATIYLPIFYIGIRHAYIDWWNFVSVIFLYLPEDCANDQVSTLLGHRLLMCYSSHGSMEDDWNERRYIPSGWWVICISKFDVYLTWFNCLTKFMDAFFWFQPCAINFVLVYPCKLPTFIKSHTKIWKRRPGSKWTSFCQPDIVRCLVRFQECFLRFLYNQKCYLKGGPFSDLTQQQPCTLAHMLLIKSTPFTPSRNDIFH